MQMAPVTKKVGEGLKLQFFGRILKVYLKINGFYLEGCLSHEEVRVVSIKNDNVRPTFKCEIVGEYTHKKFLGFNRAKASILEACILASRLKILDEKKIREELDYLHISVKKTGSYKELRSWKKINKFIENYFENKQTKQSETFDKGSIGAWEEKNILEVVKRCKKKVKVSATIGDIFYFEGIIKKLQQFDNFGLDYIKFGINTENVLELKDLIYRLGKFTFRTKLVLVVFVDKNSILKIVEENLEIFYQNNVRFLILDTYKKSNQNLTTFCKPLKIKDFINKCSVKKINVGLAGRLQAEHIIKLKLLNPYVMGFRSAICSDLNRKFLSEKKLIFLSSQFFSNKSNAIERAGA